MNSNDSNILWAEIKRNNTIENREIIREKNKREKVVITLLSFCKIINNL